MICSVKKISFVSDGNKLSGLLYYPEANEKPPGLLFLHGAGSSNKGRFSEWQKFLCDHGYSSFIFDCRGVGESEGSFEDGSLNNRLRDALSGLQAFIETGHVDPARICVVGNSMSGHTAVRMTERVNLKAIMLAYAAAYGKNAEDKPLNAEFTNEIRKENSWHDSPVFPIVNNFAGATFVVYGEYEEVIPKEIQNKYLDIAQRKGEGYVIKNATHRMLMPQNEKEHTAMQELFSLSVKFLNKRL